MRIGFTRSEKPANTNDEANKDCQDLLDAAKIGDLVKVKCLIAQGVNIEVNNLSGHTALLCAARRGHEAVARLLLEN